MSISHYPDVSGRAPERRSHQRVLVGAPAFLLAANERTEAECVDLSMGGAAVRSRAQLTTGTSVVLELSLGADRASIAVECEVVRTHDEVLGLRFLALTRHSVEAIASLL